MISFLNLPITKNFLAYASSSLGIRICTALFTPFWIYSLNLCDYGFWILINSIITLIYLITGASLKNYLNIEYIHYNENDKKKFLNQLINIYLIFGIPFLISLGFFLSFFKQNINNKLNSFLITFILICSCIHFINEFYFQILRLEYKTSKVIKLQFLSALVSILSILFLVIIFKKSIIGLIISYFFSLIIIAFSWLKYFKENLYKYYEKPNKEFIYHLKKTIQLLPYNFSGWCTAYSPRWFLAIYSSLTDVGIYSIADLFVQVFELAICQPIQGVYLPHILNEYKQNNNNFNFVEKKNQKILFLSMSFFLISITFAFLILNFFLKKYLSKNYYLAINYGLLLTIGSIFIMGCHITSAIIQYKKQTKFLSFIGLLYPALSSLMYFLLIPKFKISGAVFGFILSWTLMFIIHLYYNVNSTAKNNQNCRRMKRPEIIN